MASYHSLKIKYIVKQTEDTVTVHLKQPIFKKIRHKAGQFVTVILTIDGKEVRRSYSLSSAPRIDDTIAFTVKRISGGLVSNYINDNFKVGDTVQIMEPMGNFFIEPDAKKERHVVLIGGGSGITPLISMLKTLLHEEARTQVSLIYASRNEANIIFSQELDQLKKAYNARLTVVHVLSQPSASWGGYKGRLDKNTFINIYNLLDKKQTPSFYLCGPEGLMEQAKLALSYLKIPENQIFTESFVATAPLEDKTSAKQSISDQKVRIKVDNQWHEVLVPAGKFILQAGLEAGLDLPFSCQSGLCTACMSKCTNGKVSMGGNDLLTADELAQGFVLTCVSKPISEDVSIEIGG